MDRAALTAEKAQLEAEYKKFQGMGLNLNMARGKPGPHQMDLAMDMMKMTDYTAEGGVDARNYGNLEGLYEARVLFADVMGVKPEEVFVGGNSQPAADVHVAVHRVYVRLPGISVSLVPGGKAQVPVPCARVRPAFCHHRGNGFEMINIPMREDGPDMDLIEKLVAEDDTIKASGAYPNTPTPTATRTATRTVRRFAAMKTAAPRFQDLLG